MNKKEWKEHCEWLDTFRQKIITDNTHIKIMEKKPKKKKKKIKKRKISGYYLHDGKITYLYEERR